MDIVNEKVFEILSKKLWKNFVVIIVPVVGLHIDVLFARFLLAET